MANSKIKILMSYKTFDLGKFKYLNSRFWLDPCLFATLLEHPEAPSIFFTILFVHLSSTEYRACWRSSARLFSDWLFPQTIHINGHFPVPLLISSSTLQVLKLARCIDLLIDSASILHWSGPSFSWQKVVHCRHSSGKI